MVLKKNPDGHLYLQTMFHTRAQAVQDLMNLGNTKVLYTMYAKRHKSVPGIHYPTCFEVPEENTTWVYVGRTKGTTLVELIKDKNIVTGSYIPLKVYGKPLDYDTNFLAHLRVLEP